MSHLSSIATILFLVFVSSSLASPVSDWKTKSGLTTDAVEQAKAAIAAKMDDVKVSFQDWKRGEVDSWFFTLAVKEAEVAVNHEVKKAYAKVMSFYGNQNALGLLSDGDLYQLKKDLVAAVEGPFEAIMKALASMTNTLTVGNISEDLEDSGKQVDSVVAKTKETILDVSSKAFQSVDKIMAAKFDV